MKRAFFILLAVVLLLPVLAVSIFYGHENWAGRAAWGKAEAVLRSCREPLRLEDLRPKPIPDAKNMASAPIFRQLFTLYSPQRAEVNTLRLPPFVPVPTAQSGTTTLMLLARRFHSDFSGSASDAARIIQAGLAPMEPLLESIRKAAERPDAVWPIEEERGLAMPFLAPLQRTAEVLAARATVSFSTGNSASALSDLELIIRLARDTNQPPSLAGCVAEQAILGCALNVVRDGLAQGSWSDADLSRIETELTGFRLLSSFADGVRGERAQFLEAPEIANAQAEQMFKFIDFTTETSEWVSRAISRLAWDLRPSGWMDLDRANYALFAQDWLNAVVRKGYLRPWALDDWNARLRALRRNPAEFFRTPVTAFAMATYAPTARKAAYTQTGIDLARIACAIERHRLAIGSPPPNLDTLAPRWIDEIPRDAIGGSRYFYQVTGPDSYTLYGCGWNARDDGGSVANANPILGPSTADDWVWQSAPSWRQQASSARREETPRN